MAAGRGWSHTSGAGFDGSPISLTRNATRSWHGRPPRVPPGGSRSSAVRRSTEYSLRDRAEIAPRSRRDRSEMMARSRRDRAEVAGRGEIAPRSREIAARSRRDRGEIAHRTAGAREMPRGSACASEHSLADRAARERDGDDDGPGGELRLPRWTDWTGEAAGGEPRLPRWTGEAAARCGEASSSGSFSGSFVYEHRPPRPQCLKPRTHLG